MDLTGSLINTNLRIYPTKTLLNFLTDTPSMDETPANFLKFLNREITDKNQIEKQEFAPKPIQLSDEDIKNLNNIKKVMKINANHNTEDNNNVENDERQIGDRKNSNQLSREESGKNNVKEVENIDKDTTNKENNCKRLLEHKCQEKESKDESHLTTSDIDWLYNYIQERRGKGDKNVPYLHELLKGAVVEMPNNKVIKRNPVLEARCVKLRAQQEAREYRKMTKSVDNVRMRFPEDSINYQLKQVNRQLIAIGQFIISIFAGFLFGFRGVEWMVGNLDFGFRLLLGVMCALVIALAEIYFLAKKLNEELNVPETIQLGGPPKFANDPYQTYTSNKAIDKEHQD